MTRARFFERVVMWGLLAVFGGVVLHAPISVAASVLFPDIELILKAWKELLMGGIAIVLLGVVIRRGLLKVFLRDRLLQLAVLFAAIHVLLLPVFWQGAVAAGSGLLIDLRFVLFFVLVYAALRVYPGWRKPFLVTGIVGALVVTVFAILQVTLLPHDFLKYLGYGRDTIVPYLTVDLNYDFVRISSTLRGPNPLGAYAAIVLSVLAAALLCGAMSLRRRRDIVLSGVLGLGAIVALLFSYSRSALVAAAVAVGIVFVATIGRKLPSWAWITGCAIAGALAVVLALSWQTPFVQNVLLHENPEGGSAISSNDDHVTSLEDGLQRLLSQPFGAGIGSTGSASLHTDAPHIIENYYFFVAHEVGWLGLLLFLALFGYVLYKLWKNRRDWLSLGVFASGIGMALIGVLLPVWADDTVALIWWGLAAVAIATNPHKKS